MNNEHKKTILLVEDEVLIAMFEKKELEKYGYSVITVTSGEKAIEAVKSTPEIDLILMDIDPGKGIDGTQAAEIILKDRDMPVVFCSSHTEPEVVEKTEKITSYGYVVKGSNITALDASIKMAFKLFDANQKLQRELTERKQAAARVKLEEQPQQAQKTEAIGTQRFVKQWAQPTSYKNEAEQQAAGILSKLIVVTGIGYLFGILIGIYYKDVEVIATLLIGIIILIVPYILLRRGQVNVASITLTLLVIGTLTASAMVGQGINDLAIVAFPVIYFFASVSLNRTVFRICLVFTLLAVFWLTFGELNGWFVTKPFEPTNWVDFIIVAVVLGVAAFASDLLATSLRKNLERAEHEITERKQTERVLQLQEERLRLALAASKQGWFDLDVPTGAVMVSPEYVRMIGYDPANFETDLQGWVDGIHPEDRDSVLKVFREALETGDTLSMDYRRRTSADDWLWISSTGKVVEFDSEHKPLRMIGTHTDITERKQAEKKIKASLKEKEVLLKEIHHRVKNNLQVVSGLLKLQSVTIEDQQFLAMFRDSQNRIKTMSLIHENLYQSEDLASINFGDYVRKLAPRIFHSYSLTTARIALRTEVEDIELDLDTSIPCSLILNELISNALKYAFPEDRAGEIYIAFHTTNDHQLALMVRDNGIGLPEDLDFRHTKSLGLQLVCLFTDQLEGAIELDRSGGTAFQITFTKLEHQKRS